MFSRIIVANRGEVALRVLRACAEMGIETVAVYSQADAGARYLELADDAVCIGPPPATESYLNIARIIAAAEITNVDAIHPGYGFLAERSDFAEICEESNIVFIGPRSEVMRKMGDKVQARRIARDRKISVLPGSDGPIENDDEALALAQEIGYPVIIKAAAGGGGRGMRVAHNEISLRNMLALARSEASQAFKDDSLYIEKLLERARHVEVQILADNYGNVSAATRNSSRRPPPRASARKPGPAWRRRQWRSRGRSTTRAPEQWSSWWTQTGTTTSWK